MYLQFMETSGPFRRYWKEPWASLLFPSVRSGHMGGRQCSQQAGGHKEPSSWCLSVTKYASQGKGLELKIKGPDSQGKCVPQFMAVSWNMIKTGLCLSVVIHILLLRSQCLATSYPIPVYLWASPEQENPWPVQSPALNEIEGHLGQCSGYLSKSFRHCFKLSLCLWGEDHV